MKKSLSVLLVLLLTFVLSLSACSTDTTIEISDDGYWVINGEKTDFRATPESTADENPQGLQFYIQDDGTYIVSCGDAKYLSNIVIPATYKGGAVVGIDSEAFYGCTSLTSVVIPDSVTSIGGSSVFSKCTSITSVVIPDSVTSIGYCAFESCTSLTSVTIGDSVSTIDSHAFYNCPSLEGIIIPSSVTSIGMNAFGNCKSLTCVTFEGTVEQWNAIDKDNSWNGRLSAGQNTIIPATEVICSNGTVPLN